MEGNRQLHAVGATVVPQPPVPEGTGVTPISKGDRGWKSRKFILTVIMIVGTVASAVTGMVPPEQAMYISNGVAVAYTLANAIQKFVPESKG